MVSTPAAAAMPRWRRSTPAMSTGWSLPGAIALAISPGDAALLRHSKFEVTPILVDGRLLICTPFNEVIALDPGDGHELWRFDPKIAMDSRPGNLFTCRGVAFWRDSGGAAGPCATRVLTVTNDARLIALDLETGRRCAGFGQEGEVRIEPGKPLLWPGEGR